MNFSLITSSHFQSSPHSIIIITSPLSRRSLDHSPLSMSAEKKKIIHDLIFTIPPPFSSCGIPQGIKECRKDLFMATLAWKPSNALDWRARACSVISFISHPRHHKQHRSQSAVIPTEHSLNDCCLPESCCCCGCLALSQTLLKDLSKYILPSTALVRHRVAATVL